MKLSEEHENQIIRAVQHAVPFSERPFAEIGTELGIPEPEVLEFLQKWSEQGTLREISAVLEGSALGYDSALVAGRVAEERLAEVVAILNDHPTITHNYLRDHEYNLWYTIAAPFAPGVDAHIAALSSACGTAFHALRRTETFKIGVNFDLRTRQNHTEVAPPSETGAVRLTDESRRLFRALQTPAPLVLRPFAELASACGTDEATLIAFGREHLGGAIRRYVGTLRHRKLGVRANAMTVWCAPSQRSSELGAILAAAPEVSHCYARNPIEGFPYTLYSMIHGPDLQACEVVAARLADKLQLAREDYRLLVSLEEYKKIRLRYFLPELDEWWAEHGA
ncbi:MAG: Lrp/AsnC family transcriptional regulator [bacterium]|nr:Lrp/AsnC family transcriptional regulator [bacterium]